MPITSKNLKLEDDDLDDILDEEDEDVLDEEEEKDIFEEEVLVKPVKKIKKVKPSDHIYVTLLKAESYSIRGMKFRRGVPTKIKRSELKYFTNNGWFTVRS